MVPLFVALGLNEIQHSVECMILLYPLTLTRKQVVVVRTESHGCKTHDSLVYLPCIIIADCKVVYHKIDMDKNIPTNQVKKVIIIRNRNCNQL